MLVNSARVFFFCLCFGGFLLQSWKLFFKFYDGTTTTIISSIKPKNGQMKLPRLSICLDPPTTLSRLSELGLAPNSWNSNQLIANYTGNVTWPITSENNTDLFDRSMFLFEEVFERIDFFNHTITKGDTHLYKFEANCDISDLQSRNLLWRFFFMPMENLYVSSECVLICDKKTCRVTAPQGKCADVQVTNTLNAGKCFTLLIDAIPAILENLVQIKLKNVFEDRDGRFRIFLHAPGLELVLVHQLWLSHKKLVRDVPLGTYTDIMLRRHIRQNLQKTDESVPPCQKDWTYLDYFKCVDEFLKSVREPIHCSSIFDTSLNQSATILEKPICTSLRDLQTLADLQGKVFWDAKLVAKCPKNCNLDYFTASITDIKKFGSDETFLYLKFETLDTLIEEEVPVHDAISMISAVGGSLGLFLGFSFLDIAFRLTQALPDRI